MEILNWVRDNWFDLLQSLGIIGGFFFTALSLRIDANERRVGNLFAITKQHREIWTAIYSRPDLKRVVDAHADLEVQPITDEEGLFVNLLILHLETGYRASQAGMFTLPGELKTDISAFFSFPIPGAVWERSKRLQNVDFVRFVEEHRDTK
jgi:hypothetical protein